VNRSVDSYDIGTHPRPAGGPTLHMPRRRVGVVRYRRKGRRYGPYRQLEMTIPSVFLFPIPTTMDTFDEASTLLACGSGGAPRSEPAEATAGSMGLTAHAGTRQFYKQYVRPSGAASPCPILWSRLGGDAECDRRIERRQKADGVG